jgi:class 3 adenylate cyclase/tetratricopeptide (TPR) repeat protein
MICPRCRHDNPEAVKFCGECGARQESVCPSCQTPNPLANRFCHACGGPLAAAAPDVTQEPPRTYTPKHLADKILTSRGALEGERKQVSVLFVDVSGFTSLAERLDPEDVHAIMKRAFALMLDEVHRYEGTVNQFLGDGIMALFGAPVAHEDHALRAVHAALGIERALAAYRGEVQRARRVDFQVRQGLNTGPVVVGSIGSDLRMDYTAVGDTTNVAARLLQAAPPGQILVSEAVHRLAQGFFAMEALGPLTLKGKREPVAAWRVTAPLGARTRIEVEAERGLTPLLGRAHELGVLEECFARAAGGRGQAVFVVGEPGIGKSRLLVEFRRRVGDRADWMEGHCLSFGHAMALHPVADLLRRHFRIDESDSAAASADKIDRAVAALGDGARPVAPYLRTLLSVDPGDAVVAAMTPQERRAETLHAIRQFLAQAAAARPLVVVVEDLHWIDTASEQLLRGILDAVPGLRALVVFTYRPGYAQPFGDRSYYTRIAPSSLSLEDSGRMAEAMLASERLDDELKALIGRKAEGNPFYVEEVVKSLRESQALRPDGGRYVLAGPVAAITVPDTIQDVITARIDRLAEEPKHALQVASVIGREFTRRLLDRLEQWPARADGPLRDLLAVELIREKSVFPELGYMFTHALTHDVAYESLLRERRRELHRLIGLAIEGLYADRLAEHHEVLAHHFTRAEDWPRALDHLVRSGEKAAHAFAPREALALYDQALAAAERCGDGAVPAPTLMQIHAARSDLLYGIGDYPAAREAASAHVALARRSGDAAAESEALLRSANAAMWMEEFDVALAEAQCAVDVRGATGSQGHAGGLHVRGFIHAVTGELESGARELDRSLALSRQADRFGLQGDNLHMLAIIAMWQGRYRDSLALAAEGVRIGREHRLLVPLLRCLWNEGVTRAGLGEFDAALAALEEGLALAERAGDERFTSRYVNTLAWLRIDCGDWDRGLALGLRALEMARRSRHATGLERVAFIQANQSVALVARGDLASAGEVLEEVHHIVQHPPPSRWMTWRYSIHCFASLGELWLARGEPDRADRFADQSLEIAVRGGAAKYESRVWRLKGECALARRRWDEAEPALRRALEIARAIGEARQLWKGHEALGRLHHARGNAEAARDCHAAGAAVVENVLAKTHDAGLRAGVEGTADVRVLRGASGPTASAT